MGSLGSLLRDALDFAGADWENQRPASRARLLERAHLPPRFTGWKWRQLPETAQVALAKPLMDDEKVKRKVGA